MVHPRTPVESGLEFSGEFFIIVAALLLQNVINQLFPSLPLCVNIILIVVFLGVGVVLRRHATRLSIEWWEKHRGNRPK
ncbi:MAG: hypothetical protein AABW89_05110 [Nanoarchaeota archaeon]